MLPTTPDQRIQSIDVLRGIVVLGILILNAAYFAFPSYVAGNPSLFWQVPFEGIDVTAFAIAWIGFEGAQRAIFSILFGVGIAIFCDRVSSDERSANLSSLHYRRMFGLMLFGLVDIVILLWAGDIIFLYGVAGMLIYFARDWSVRRLLTVAFVICVILTLLLALFALVEQLMDDSLSDYDVKIARELEQRSGGYLSAFPAVMWISLKFQLGQGILYSLWDVIMMMLVGLALYKLRVLDASRSYTTYVLMTVIGLGVGLTINAIETLGFIRSGFEGSLSIVWSYQFGRAGVACGVIGVVMLICKLEWFGKFRSCFAAVGRMALTNYLMQSFICLIYFVILGNFGQLRYHQIFYVVFAIWAFQLIYSPLWLKRFRYGPLEYLWRKITYSGRLKPDSSSQ